MRPASGERKAIDSPLVLCLVPHAAQGDVHPRAAEGLRDPLGQRCFSGARRPTEQSTGAGAFRCARRPGAGEFARLPVRLAVQAAAPFQVHAARRNARTATKRRMRSSIP